MTTVAALRDALGDTAVIDGAEVDPRYLGDWILKRPNVRPAALVRVRSTEEVAATLRVCNDRRVPVVAQGGRTGMAGSATPDDGWVILSLELMRAISAVDADQSTIVVEAGALLGAVQDAADEAGFLFPLDIGSRGSCTIGGNLSTNAGGNRVLRYGMMRELVLGIEAVLPDGTIVSSMLPMLKNNSGYDLKQLFVGSEGTLGVVTRAVLRLFPKPLSTQTALCAVTDHASILRLLGLARSRLGPTLSAFEVMWSNFYRLGTDGLGQRPPLAHGHDAYVLIENMGAREAGDAAQFQEFLETALDEAIIADAVLAQTERERVALWSIRDSSGEFVRTPGPNIGFDVSLPIGAIGDFIEDCRKRLKTQWPSVEIVWFGHLADSNIHIAVRVGSEDPQPEEEIDDIVYGCVADYAGSISAEHGVGLLKRPYMGATRSDDELGMMRALKRALDPNLILNPGKIFA